MSERTSNKQKSLSNLTIYLTIGTALSGGFGGDVKSVDSAFLNSFSSEVHSCPYRIKEESLSNDAYMLTDDCSDYLILLSFARKIVDNLVETPQSIRSIIAEHFWEML